MLKVYRSNRAELLAQLLAHELRLDAPGPFEQLEVVVNTWPTSRWLGEQLAAVNGISALVRFLSQAAGCGNWCTPCSVPTKPATIHGARNAWCGPC